MESLKKALPLIIGGIIALLIPKDAIYQFLDNIFKPDETK